MYSLTLEKMAKFQRDLGMALILYFGLLTSLGTCHLIQPEGLQPKLQTKLRFVSVVFRHGDRNVDNEHSESYQNDPYKDRNNYPDGDGQLINAGKRRSYQLGQMLRIKYNNFLGNLYYQPNIYAHSSPIIRCKMSLQLVLAALYPPTDVQKWNPFLLWQPTNFISSAKLDDDLLFAILCPTYTRPYHDILQNNLAVKKKVAEFDDLKKEASIHAGENITTVYGLWLLFNTLAAQSAVGLRLPEWTQSIFPCGELLDAAVLQFDIFSYGPLNRRNGGVLLRRIMNDMTEVKNGTLKDRKINLFSGHDINVAAMLQALNIFDYRIPQYTSSVIIELHEKNDEFFVKVVHYLGIPSIMLEKSIPGCETLCPFEKFVQLTSASTATTEELKCPEEMASNLDDFLTT